MKKDKTLEPISEELIYFPLTGLRKKFHIQMGTGVPKLNKNAVSLFIKITAKCTPNQIHEFVNEHKSLIYETTKNLPKNAVKPGTKSYFPEWLLKIANKYQLRPSEVMNFIKSFKDSSWKVFSYRTIEQRIRRSRKNTFINKDI